MEDLPGGTWIVLEGRTKKEVDLLSIGYKYNSSSVLTFVVTKGAGSTVAGRPYEARFPDVYGNVHARNVPRPEVLNKYFDHCNAVDAHNQARQGNLALEKSWIRCNPYYRIWTTFIGMQVTDLWQLHRSLKPRKFRLMSIKHFADRVGLICSSELRCSLKKIWKTHKKNSKMQSKRWKEPTNSLRATSLLLRLQVLKIG